jgi:hypothetical protein
MRSSSSGTAFSTLPVLLTGKYRLSAYPKTLIVHGVLMRTLKLVAKDAKI